MSSDGIRCRRGRRTGNQLRLECLDIEPVEQVVSYGWGQGQGETDEVPQSDEVSVSQTFVDQIVNTSPHGFLGEEPLHKKLFRRDGA